MRMKKRLTIAVLLAVGVVGSQAAVVRWAGTFLGGTSDYADGSSWSADSFANAYGSIPLSTDSHALINNRGFGLPTISSAIGQAPTTIGIGWDFTSATPAVLNVVAGGTIAPSSVVLGFSNNAPTDGTLNVSGGNMTVTTGLTLGQPTAHANTGIGTINQSGGILHLNAIAFNNGVINLSDSAFFLINGDTTGLDLIGGGWITAPVAGQSVVEVFNAGAGRTEYTVIPEPATLGMVALASGGILFIRRKFTI